MPLLQMPHPNNDDGYAIEDFDNVDPTLGSNEDLDALTAKLRKAGISLCLDFVMNHTASTHRWAMGKLYNYDEVSRDARSCWHHRKSVRRGAGTDHPR